MTPPRPQLRTSVIRAAGSAITVAGLMALRGLSAADDSKSPAAAGGSRTNAVPASSATAAAAADPLMTAPLLQATSEGRVEDVAEAAARRRREQRTAGITNVVPRTVSGHGGALAYIAREKKPSSVLQLFNPLAPAALGVGSAQLFEWRPDQGVAPLPRAFRDERTHEPVGITILGSPR